MAAIAAGALVAPPASAAASLSAVRCQPVEVSGGTESFTSPDSVASGVQTFQATTTDPAGMVLGLFRLDPGIDVDDFVVLLRVAFAGVGEERLEAAKAVAEQSTLLGGIAALPGRPARFTQALWPGTYHLIDYRDILAGAGGGVAVRALTATDRWQPCSPPQPGATIEMVNTADGPRYRAPATLRTNTPILVRNLFGQIQEAVIRPVGPGVTAADVQRFFEAVDNGQPPPSNPFTGLIPQGMPVIHPSLAAILSPNLAPGRYAVLSFLFDNEGRRFAALGMVAVFDVT
jgi:hypothetical protein